MSVVVFSVGLVCASACATRDTTAEEVEVAVNAAHPTGISSGWSISKDETFAGGQSNPCPCNTDTERQHWLLNC